MRICTLASVILALVFSATMSSVTCLADDFDWTGGGDNNWNNGANWTNTTPGGTETIPDADDNVSFAIDATTGIGTAANFTNSAIFTMATNRDITLSGSSIANTGTLTFGADSSNNFGGVPDTRFTIDSAIALTGGGDVVLTGTETGFLGSGTLTNVDNVIRGSGQLQVDVINQNTIRAEGGVLSLEDGISLNNSGGQVALAADGELNLVTSLLEGGTLAATLGSLVRGGTLKDVTVTGTLTERTNNNTNWEGAITNQGTITMTADGSNNFGGVPDTRFTIDSPVTLNGGGIVELTGKETGLTGSGTLTNINNTIRGFGQMQVALNNQGTVRAQGGSLKFLDGVAIDNTAGVVQITATGVLDLGTSRLANGNLSALAGSLIAGGTLAEVTVAGTLTQATNRNTIWDGTINNQGTITFTDDNTNNMGGVLDTRFHLDTPVTLNGGGTIVLMGSDTGLDGSGTLTNVDNTIEAGVGGVLDVDIQNGATAVVSIGDGKLLQLNGALSGGTLDSHENGRIRTGADGKLSDLIVTGMLTNRIHNGLLLEGTITNQGVLTMEADGTNNFGGIPDTRYEIESPVTLSGGGEVVLTGTETGFTGSSVLTNVDNTIRGFGQIQVQTVNQGAIEVEGGTLSLESGITIDNSAGSVAVATDGNLNLGTGTLRGGALSATLGSIVRNGTLDGVTLSGTLAQSINRGTTLAGTITNQGVLTFTADGTNNLGGIPDTRFSVDTTATLTGGGEVVLNGTETGLSGNGLLTNANHTIRGFGQIQVRTVNDSIVRAEGGKLLVSRDSSGNGEWQVAAGAELEINTPLLSAHTITVDPTGTFDFNGSRLEVVDLVGNFQHEVGTYAPGQQVGVSTLVGDLQMGSGAALEIQLSGTTASEFDQVQISGTATVDGTLLVRAIDQIGALGTDVTFTGLTANSLEGTFDDLPVGGDHLGFGVFLDSLDFDTVGDRIEISASQLLFPADFDADGDVDNVDLATWKIGNGTSSDAALADGDADADGDVDGHDFLIWQQFRGSMTPLQVNTNVPEPSTALLLLLAMTITRIRSNDARPE